MPLVLASEKELTVDSPWLLAPFLLRLLSSSPALLCVCGFSPPLLRTPVIGFRAHPNPVCPHLVPSTSAKTLFSSKVTF